MSRFLIAAVVVLLVAGCGGTATSTSGRTCEELIELGTPILIRLDEQLSFAVLLDAVQYQAIADDDAQASDNLLRSADRTAALEEEWRSLAPVATELEAAHDDVLRGIAIFGEGETDAAEAILADDRTLMDEARGTMDQGKRLVRQGAAALNSAC